MPLNGEAHVKDAATNITFVCLLDLLQWLIELLYIHRQNVGLPINVYMSDHFVFFGKNATAVRTFELLEWRQFVEAPMSTADGILGEECGAL